MGDSWNTFLGVHSAITTTRKCLEIILGHEPRLLSQGTSRPSARIYEISGFLDCWELRKEKEHPYLQSPL